MNKELLEQYINEYKSTNDIAVLENKSKTTVRYWINKYGLKTICNPGTKTINLTQKCLFCSQTTINNKAYCSTNCKSKMYQKRNPEKQIIKNISDTLKLRLIKKELVDYKGGKCSKCDYKVNYASLSFHHIDPNEKKFRLSGKFLRNDFNVLKQEVDKCELLCENCHKEEHNIGNTLNTKQAIKGHKIRNELIQLKGGKCSVCSYNKCNSSLAFHHLNESTKEFQIDVRTCNGYKYERLLDEVNKCLLLCHNCHMELHNPDLKI